ncbi:hypothetical protein [Snodgrassella sp. CS2]|uniref:hypothetical protein n=1 Tax=Snodgrassella sp. CS2 TaxID=3418953 RepID=UPI003D02D025
MGGAAGAIVGETMGPIAIGGFNGIAGELARLISCSSSNDDVEKDCEETEEQHCWKVKNKCIVDCSHKAMLTEDHRSKFCKMC